MQQTVNTANIDIFACNVSVDILNRVFAFDFGDTVFKNSPAGFGVELAVSVVDQDGVSLATIDWDDPQIPNAAVTTLYDLDLAAMIDWQFLFQKYKVIVAANDNGTIVYLEFPVKDVCQPNGFTSGGYVEGDFYLKMDCNNNNITVKEITNFTYQKSEPTSKSVDGTLYFPIGTKDPLEFSFTPFSDTNVYTGNYRLDNTTTATYDLGDGFFVIIAFSTVINKDFTCEKAMETLICCLVDYQEKMQRNCGNAIGVDMQQRWDSVSLIAAIGFAKEMNGEDASPEAAQIKNILRCNCAKKAIKPVQVQSASAGYFDVEVTGVGGTEVTRSVVGMTKNFEVSSKIYQITKKVPADTAFTIYPAVTSTPNTVKYPIGFNYDIMAATIYTATENNNTLLTQLNSLIFASGIDLSNIDGKCIIDLSSTDYFLSRLFSAAATTVKNILVGTTTYTAPANTLISNVDAIEAWLNGVSPSIGTYNASYSQGVAGYYSNILSTGNANQLVSVTYMTPNGDVTVAFQKTNVSIIALFQALIDYLCELDTTQVQLGQSLSLCSLNSSNQVVTTIYPASTLLSAYQTAEAAVICDFANRIRVLTAATCDTIKALFPTSINVMQETDYILGTKGGLCARIFPVELGTRIFELGVYSTTFMAAFCNAVTLCNGGNICTPYSQFQVAVSELSPVSSDLFDLIVSFVNSGAVSNDISYARIDNTTPPYTYFTEVGILPNQSPYQIPLSLFKGQYSIGIKPNYADGRECPTVYITTPACTGILAFNATINGDGDEITVDYTAQPSVEAIKWEVTYPTGGVITGTVDNGDPIVVTVTPTGGTFTVQLYPICCVDSGWIGAATAPVYVSFTPAGIVTVEYEASYAFAIIDALVGIAGFAFSAPMSAVGTQTGTHNSFSGIICATTGDNSAGDGFDIYINNVFVERVVVFPEATNCSSILTVATTDSIDIKFNNNS